MATILSLISSYWRVGVLALVFFAGWYVNGWRWETEVESLKQGYAEAMAKAESDAREKQNEMAGQVAAIDQKYTKELNDARLEIERLSAAVDDGTASLRVNATCGGSSPEAGPGPGVGNAASARLSDSARRNYFVLRERIQTITAMLTACQEIVRKDRE